MKLILLGVLAAIAIVTANPAPPRRGSIGGRGRWDTSTQLRDTSGTDSSGGETPVDTPSGKECKDIRGPERCNSIKERGLCSKRWWATARCAKTCEKCDEFLKCKDFAPAWKCEKIVNEGRCESKKGAPEACPKSCGVCT